MDSTVDVLGRGMVRAGHALARTGAAGRGKAGGSTVDVARQGEPSHGIARKGLAWRGMDSTIDVPGQGELSLGAARQGWERRAMARRAVAWIRRAEAGMGKAMRGMAPAGLGMARTGSAGVGAVRTGMVVQGPPW